MSTTTKDKPLLRYSAALALGRRLGFSDYTVRKLIAEGAVQSVQPAGQKWRYYRRDSLLGALGV